MSKEKAEIIGFLCAEGCFYKYVTKYWEYHADRKKSYFRVQKVRVLQFANNNKRLQRRFLFLLKKVYNYALKFYGPSNSMRITIKRRKVIDDLIKYSKYNSFVWKIPKEILFGSKKMKIAFLRGLFDGDGNYSIVRKNEIRARIYSVNIKELRKVSKILFSFEIKNIIYGPYFGPKSKTGIYELTTTGKNAEAFIKLIRPTKI